MKLGLTILSVLVLLCGCGGARDGRGASDNNSSEISQIAEESPWANETVISPTTEQATTAAQDIQNSIADIIISEEDSDKKSRTSSVTIDRTITGLRGGTITITGVSDRETTTGTVFPITTHTVATIAFDSYEDSRFGLHGTSEYEGSTTITSRGNFETNFTTNGTFSYKNSDGVQNLVTELTVKIVSVDGERSVTYTYIVNGQTISGSL